MTQPLRPRGKSTRIGRKPVDDMVETPVATASLLTALPSARFIRQEQRPSSFGQYVVQPKQ
ncbi:hypothetical protein GCM10007304_17060 [Rhodococcoides trifolii]|uniref:Uncharacterized protein n=1 Tax=Rhodococcoides trifolii TaxID=908250 RepID=A0A917CXR7_9NOCA|nr:hypothetical protein [Rhodococcus trifolii]GGG03518.1 hypothetical protein GCM10007304_17060 [Rhodococcus trifolii]